MDATDLPFIDSELRSEAIPRKNLPYASGLPSCSGAARSKFSTKPDQYSSRRWQREQIARCQARCVRKSLRTSKANARISSSV